MSSAPTDPAEVVRRVDRGDEVVLEVRGELDIHASPELEAALLEVAGAPVVVLDLSELTFVDSAGLRVILLGHQALASSGGRLIVRSPSPPTRRLFEITGIDDVLAIEG